MACLETRDLRAVTNTAIAVILCQQPNVNTKSLSCQQNGVTLSNGFYFSSGLFICSIGKLMQSVVSFFRHNG